MGADRPDRRRGPRARDPRPPERGGSALEAGLGRGPNPGEAALDVVAEGSAMKPGPVSVPHEARAALWLLAPGLLVIGLFFLLPIAASLLLSFTDFDIYAIADTANIRLAGLANYAALVRDPLFWIAMRNTFYFVLVGGPLTIGVALAVALLLQSRL